MDRRVLAGLVAAAALFGAWAAASAAAKAGPGPVTVPISISGGQGTATGARPMVKVRVGRSKPVPLLLDTGSSGLRIFEPVVRTGPGSGVTVTSRRNVITYAGGHRYAGVVASAVVKIGAQATAGPVPFSLVQQASCTRAKPSCPAAGGIPGAMRNGVYGILGIGTGKSGGGVISPVLGMPGRLGRRWSIHLRKRSGSLVLGAPAPKPRSVAATLRLPSRGSRGAVRFWADARAPVCLAVGAVRTCVPGLFDSGTFQMQIWGSPLDTVPTEPGGARVLQGTRVSTSAAGSVKAFWTFPAGATKSKDTVTVHGGRPFVNFGVQAYYAFTVTLDDRTGTLILGRR